MNSKALFLILALCGALVSDCIAGISVVGSLTRTAKARPGDKIEGVILVRNEGAEATEVKVLQTDYQFSADGHNNYGEPGKLPRSNADWFTVTPSRLNLAKGETAEVRYRGTVPNQADLDGSYWSLIIVEPFAPPAPQVKGQTNEPEMGLHTMLRFGVQMVTELGGGSDFNLKILGKRVAKQKEKRMFQFDVENDGKHLVNPGAWVELYNKQGASIGKFEAKATRIYPGCSVRFNMDLSAVPPGRYSALAVVERGGNDAVGGQYDLQIDN